MSEELGVTSEETETPTTDDATVAAPAEETPAESQEETQVTDGRDWQAYARKLEQENKSFKQLYKENQAQAVEKGEPAQSPEQVEAVQLLRNIIAEELAPIRSKFEAEQEERVIAEFSEDKFVKVLGPEINAALEKLPPYLASAPLQDRLDYARSQAIAQNADKLAEIHQQLGVEKAYTNQSLKKAQSGTEQSRNRAGTEKGSLWDRFRNGELSREEVYENKAELDRLERESLGLS